MNEQVLSVIEKYGQFAYDMALRQVYVNAVENLVWAILFAMPFLFFNKIRRMAAEDNVVPFPLILICFSLYALIPLACFTMAIKYIANPAYYAISLLIRG